MAKGPQILWRGNDNIINLDNVRSQATGVILNNATGSLTLYDMNDVALPAGGPFAFTYTFGSQGRYRAVIPSSATIDLDETYTFLQIIVSLVGPTGHLFSGIINARLKDNTL